MATSQVPQEQQIHWPSVLQFGLAGLASLGLLPLSASLFVAALIQLVDPVNGGPQIAASTLMVAAGLATSGVLAIPVAGYGLARLLKRAVPLPNKLPGWWRWFVLGSVGLFALALLIASLVGSIESIVWLILPPLHILGMGLPVMWLVWAGTRGLIQGPVQRTWGVFGAGLLMGPFLILIAETVLILFLAVLAFFVLLVVVSTNPEIMTTLDRLAIQMQNVPNDPQQVLEVLGPTILRPELLLGSLFFVAVCVPLIEELIKPVGVWLLAGKNLTPRDGLVLGMLSGSGYALFENFLLGAAPDAWATLAVVRTGTSVMHIFTAGLTGWALALAWRERRYFRLVLAYFLASLIHGLWNANAVLFSFTLLTLELNTEFRLPIFWVGAAPLALTVLALGALGGLLFANRRFRDLKVAEESTRE